MKKLLDMMADAPLDQLFQSAYIPQAIQQKQKADAGIIMPSMMAGSTEQASPDSSNLIGMMSEGQSATNGGGGWAGLTGGGSSGGGNGLLSAFGLSDQGTGDGNMGQVAGMTNAVEAGLISPSTGYAIESGLASMFGFTPDGKGGFIPSITTPVSILSTLSNPLFAIVKGIVNGFTNDDMMGIVSQMSVPEALAMLQSESAYGGDSTGLSLSDAMGMLGEGSYGGAGSGYGGFGGGYGSEGFGEGGPL